MKVIIKIEVSDEERRALRWHNTGKSGRATRAQVRQYADAAFGLELDQILNDYRNDPDRRKRAARKLHNLPPSLANETWPRKIS